MGYDQLFKDGSLVFIKTFITKLVYQGLKAPSNSITEAVVIALSALITLFILYKLLWLVWQSMNFILNCFEW